MHVMQGLILHYLRGLSPYFLKNTFTQRCLSVTTLVVFILLNSKSGRMKAVGWLLDVYVSWKNAVLWFKLESEEVIRLIDHYTPDFYVEPKEKVQPEELSSILLNHPNILHVTLDNKYTSVNMKVKSTVLHVYIDYTKNFRRVLRDIEKLGLIKAYYNIDILHVQRYLFKRGVAPTSKVQIEYDEGDRLQCMCIIDDELEIKPHPLTKLVFDVEIYSKNLTPEVEKDPISKILVYNENLALERAFEGEERSVLSNFSDYIKMEDPDFLISLKVEAVLRYILERAKIRGLTIQLGREEANTDRLERLAPHSHKGRVHVDLNIFLGIGIAGIVERSRFTLAPPRLSAKWPAGRTIDSRQCYEALKKDILLSKTRSFFKHVTTAKDTIFRDRGGLILSPKAGLHENVAELDYESMYPHIIIRHNISYETVTPYFINKTRRGFLGELTEKILDRRLHFKHLRRKHPKGSREWFWCEQRQLALKGILVCIYGCSGCFANRFNNVSAYEKINKIARETLVQTMNVAMREGFEVIYADSDSIFVKKEDADREDYMKLAKSIKEEIGLPISLEHHYKFLCLLTQKVNPELEATRRYFGKLMSGELYYRGIELRRHDCPSFLKNFQKRLLEILFDAECVENLKKDQFKKAQDYVVEIYEEIMNGKIDPEKLVISKVLRKPVDEYQSMFPHVVAAIQMMQKGKKLKPGEIIDFLYVNAAHKNPFRRVVPAAILNNSHCYYDKEKYSEMVLDVAETVLSLFGFNGEQNCFRPKSKNYLEELHCEREDRKFDLN